MNKHKPPFMVESSKSVGTAAMLLALTRTMADEDTVKAMLAEQGYKVVVTEVGGNSAVSEFQGKVTKAVLGAALNTGIITKTSANYHALLHATDEAKRGIMVNVASSASIAVKIAIVRDSQWVAVALFGESAIHPLTNHERAGLGIMHLGM
ncbi:HutP family protein [Sporomusa termitida]|uniref:Hut operon positive regulatory protein n=1 Tax=Sporomusa termitida TaxID=2377 RepID=A0A517DQ72_9FIRM|nr:HutP family protein [Sporomusa termitida]QDR79426.1 Hut operon positive regulatory protein [Sporomusa termitida]